MGQAKRRGSLQERVDAAKAQLVELRKSFPETITCNDCQGEIADLEVSYVRDVPGVIAAARGRCACGSTTAAFIGDREGVIAAGDALEQVLERQGA
ncbi:hypothetical protein [Paracidovorax wautersii]|uniref:Uncharacterized protein n=1 Tax=Paracidovorax wautersii TaxID=1177982 RepID=A0A1I2HTT2_9BURK|nr:hypothetical protein [Paracidovorax wautersii]SFF33289.1 hypothetical protein SAMN04489711_1348 [Paracidovorax wautersii]